ncbi:hypothetical protein QBK99_05345 [Corticibacterium sp. UT-5YL-CI-8]|nr:hypothetical protein [Tianweitania sp. UT-5YL-CI-8]
MSFWVVIALLAVVAFFAFRLGIRRERARQSELDLEFSIESSVEEGGVDRPDNPKYNTWEEAMNRSVTDDLRFLIEYSDAAGVVTEREINPTMIKLTAHRPEVKIVAYCHLRGEEREFRSERILFAKNLKTGRQITDLGQYLRGKY